ncbi:PR domain zinc finger protein 5 [Elasticomyces elasticus]|nr:PR domain zinc finger protein 5 [Elasticomyces elasticus]
MPGEWLPGQYEDIPDTNADKAEILAGYFDDHLGHAKALSNCVRDMFEAIMHGETATVPHGIWQRFWTAGQAYNSAEFNSDMNDCPAVFSEILKCLVLVTDNSKRRTENQRTLADIEWEAALAIEAEIYDIFAMQCVFESICPDVETEGQPCTRVLRGVEESPLLQLALPAPRFEVLADGKAGNRVWSYSMADLLDYWAAEPLSDGVACGFNAHHKPRALIRYKRFTLLPAEFQIVFSRGVTTEYSPARMEDIAIPEFLDLAPYADDVALPSEDVALYVRDPVALGSLRAARLQRRHAIVGNDAVYRLCGIGMFIGGNHYAAYYEHAGQWVMADDIAGVRFQHPQVGVNMGHVPYFLQYRRQKGWSQCPLDSNGHSTQGFIITRGSANPGPKFQEYDFPPARTYPCPRAEMEGCIQVFQSREAAEQHMVVHKLPTSGSSIVCKLCNKDFTTEDALADHVQTKHFHCEECKVHFAREDMLDRHLVEQHNFVACEKCAIARPFRTVAELELHENDEHAVITCAHCAETFDDFDGLRDHEKSHHFSCKVCSKVFGDDLTLLGHVQQHPRCAHCQNSFGSEALLAEHIIAHHHFPCTFVGCDTVSASREELVQHTFTHRPAPDTSQPDVEGMKQLLLDLREERTRVDRSREALLQAEYDVQQRQRAALLDAKAYHEAEIRAIDERLARMPVLPLPSMDGKSAEQ